MIHLELSLPITQFQYTAIWYTKTHIKTYDLAFSNPYTGIADMPNVSLTHWNRGSIDGLRHLVWQGNQVSFLMILYIRLLSSLMCRFQFLLFLFFSPPLFCIGQCAAASYTYACITIIIDRSIQGVGCVNHGHI